jgi:hypothetical protein
MQATQIEPAVWASEQWKRLTPQQRVWVLKFIVSDDPIASTRTAYPTATDKSVKCMSYELRKNPGILSALDFYNGKTDLEIDLDEIQKQIDAAEPGSIAATKLIALKASLKRGVKPTSEEPETKSQATDGASPKFNVGDICVQDGKKYRVTSIDVNGKPLTADEVEL